MREANSKKFLVDLYQEMVKIRCCEERFVDPILDGTIKCPVHLCSGQEAVAVGICKALDEKDVIFGAHRSHGHFLAKGGQLDALVAEVYGKETGCSRGRGGSMHLIDPDVGMLGSAPIVGGTISLALGAALSIKIRQKNNVSVSFFGDGATGEGALYESLNFASLNKLPMVFVCENNLYSTHMPIRKCRTNEDISRVAKPFDMVSYVVDGNRVLDVYEVAKEAVEFCKQEKGPVFIECKTYRLRGHVGPDDNIQGTHTDIRPEKEYLQWKKKDPITNFQEFLIKESLATENEIEAIRQRVDNEVSRAFSFAENSPYPHKSEVEKYVFK